MLVLIFFFNDTATTEIYTLSLHDALPIFVEGDVPLGRVPRMVRIVVVNREKERLACASGLEQPHRPAEHLRGEPVLLDRKSTRLNSSHANISYAVFCLKKKNMIKTHNIGA